MKVSELKKALEEYNDEEEIFIGLGEEIFDVLGLFEGEEGAVLEGIEVVIGMK